MSNFNRQLIAGLAADFKDLDLSNPTVKHSLKTATATILACFIALFLQTDQPYWAGVSAFVVMQRTVGATIYKSLLRIAGTISGAILGLILASLLVEHHLIFALIVTLIAFCGIYLTTVFRRHVYAWLFLYLTALLVLVGGLDNPTPETFVHLAFYRSFEIAIGILAGLLISNIMFVQYANKQVSGALDEGFSALEKLCGIFFNQLESPQNKSNRDVFDRQARVLMDKLFSLDDLLDFAGQESRHFSRPLDEQKNALSVRRMAEIILYCHRENVLQLSELSISDERKGTMRAINDCLKIILRLNQKKSSAEHPSDLLKEEFLRLDDLIKTFEGNSSGDSQDRFHYIQIVQCFRLLADELLFCCTPVSLPQVETKLDHTKFRAVFSGFYFDIYNFRFALSGAVAVLTVPFVWLYLDFPGYSQIVISIVACITLTIGSTSFKGYLRFTGSLVGAVVTFLILGMNIDNLLIMLFVLFVVAFTSGLVFFGEPKVSYFGIQFFLVVIVGLFGDLSPVQSLGPPFERFLGIILGVISLLLFQWLFAPAQPNAYLLHLVHQANHATREVCDWVFGNSDAEFAHLDHWQNRRLFFNLVTSIRDFEKFDDEGSGELLKIRNDVVANYRHLLHSLYAYILFQSKNSGMKSTERDLLSPIVKNIHGILRKDSTNFNDSEFKFFLEETVDQSKKRVADFSAVSEDTKQIEQVFATEISLLRIFKHLYHAKKLERSLI